MAEEQLTLVDGMSPSLRRIYQEAEKLNRRMLTLRSNIKTLEKPTSMSYLRRELKETEKQAQQTERAIKAMKSAEALNTRYRAFTVGANGRYYVNGMQVSNANRAQMAENYIRNVANGQMRRNRLLWENGRLVNGMTFDQRYNFIRAKSHPFATFKEGLSNGFFGFGQKIANTSNNFDRLFNSSGSLLNGFMRLSATVFFLSDIISRVGNIARETFIKPQSEYISNFTRVALTNDKTKTPQQMMNEIYDTASRTRAPADASMMLYNRIALSGVKASNERIRRFVESFNKVTAISGTTAQENRAVMLQLAQGIGSNRLGGDEFRSISEQAPLFKYMLAKGMGVNPGALKEMGAQGKLTAEAILSAMEKVQDEIDLIFKEAPLTIDQSIIILQNKWQKLINDQFVGYIAIRNLIKDIVTWMDTPRGKETLTAVIRGWNMFLFRTVELIRKAAPFFLWILNHLKLIATTIRNVIFAVIALKVAMGILKMVVLGFKFYEWFVSASAGAVMLRGAITGLTTQIKTAGATLHTWIPELLIILGLVLAITKLLPAIKDSIKESSWVDAELQKKFTPQQIKQAYNDQQKLLNASGYPYKPSKVFYEIQEERRRLTEQYRKDNPKEGTPEYYEKLSKNAFKEFEDMTKNMGGMANSSKNVPMVGKVKEVGKVNDKISIDNDGIEMMKAIAERQWVMQNEVTVPQQVDVHISKDVDVSDEKIAESLTGGMKIAIASSMRGAPA